MSWHADNIRKVIALHTLKRLALALTAALLNVVTLSGQTTFQNPDQLGTAMRKLGVDTVLLLDSAGVDESPLWSPDSRCVAMDVEGKWFQD